MWHQLWIPVLIPTLIIKSNCDVNKTDPNVFVRYGGHAEAEYGNQEPTTDGVTVVKTTTTVITTTTPKPTTPPPTTEHFQDPKDNVVFIPNKQTTVRREVEDYNDDNQLRIKDIMMMRTVNDATGKQLHDEKADEPNEDVVFISGKNHDAEKSTTERNRKKSNKNHYELDTEEEVSSRPKLNCTHLECNNTIKSICGAKLLNNKWKFRLFLNDCYYRKVNCAFKNEVNRYKQVEVDKCKTVGTHAEKPLSFKRSSFNLERPTVQPDIGSQRSSYSRRSMTMNFNGQICSHPCPVTCPEDYDPQCAVSVTGQKRVFVNHCKLDLNSCFYSVVWHKRPLAECVGGKKADMRQNRGFIGWMQRVGIVDNRGRLKLE